MFPIRFDALLGPARLQVLGKYHELEPRGHAQGEIGSRSHFHDFIFRSQGVKRLGAERWHIHGRFPKPKVGKRVNIQMLPFTIPISRWTSSLVNLQVLPSDLHALLWHKWDKAFCCWRSSPVWAQGLKSLLLVISCVMEMCFYRETTSDCGSEETIKATLCFLLKEMEKEHKTIKKRGSPPESDLFFGRM